MTTQQFLTKREFAAESVSHHFGIVLKEYHAISDAQKAVVEAAINEKCTVETIVCEGETYNFLILGETPVYLDTTNKDAYNYNVADVYEGVQYLQCQIHNSKS